MCVCVLATHLRYVRRVKRAFYAAHPEVLHNPSDERAGHGIAEMREAHARPDSEAAAASET